MKNMQWGMSVVLVGDDKVKGQFKMLDDTLDTANTSFDKTGNSAKNAGDKIEKAGNDAKGAGNDAKQGADGFNKVGTETEKAGKKAKTSQSFWKSLKDEFFSLKGIMAGLGIGLLTSQIIDVGNVTEGWNASMYAITGSQAAATQELQHARGVAEQLGLDIKSTTNSYIQFTAATQDTALQGKNSKKVFDAITMSMRVLNKSADDTSGALKALEQMVSKGTVSSEELKQQLGERLPGAFGAAAKAMGVTTQELNKMLEQGQVLAADLLPKLADVLTKKYGPGLSKAIESPAQSFRNFSTAVFKAYEAASAIVFNDLASGAQLLADVMNALSANLPEIASVLGQVLEALIVIVGVKLLLAFTSVVSKGIKSYIASNIAATISTDALGNVISKTTVRMNLMTAASNAARTSMAFLGGPVGVAMVAGYALYKLYGAMNETKTGAEQLEEAIGKTTKAIEEMTRAEQLSTQNLYNKLITEKKAAIEELKALAKEQALQASQATGKNSSTALGIQSWGSSEKAKIAEKELEALKNALSEVEGALFDAGMAGIKWNKVIVDGVDLAQEKANADAALAKNATQELTANQKLIVSLGEQTHLLGLTANQKLLHTNLSKLSKDATEAEIAAVTALTVAQYEQQQTGGGLTKEDDDFYQNAIDGVNGYADAWSSAGNVIIDTFGSIGQQMEKMLDNENAYNKAIEINHKKRLIEGADLEKLKIEEAQLTRANAQNEINSYGKMAGAAASMFSEKTAAARAFHAIEQMMAVASLAMSVEKMLMSNTETGVHVANETTKQTSNALTAITGAFSTQPVWVGLAAGAAMIGIMASLLGGGFSSSGTAPMSAAERQASQGTGTVLGSDDKSASIQNSIERSEDLQLDQYAEMQEMNASLNDLNNNITNLVANIVSNFGKFDEDNYSGFTGTTQKYTGKATQFNKFITGSEHWAGDPLGDFANKIIGSFNTTKTSLIDSGISIVSQTMSDVIDSGLLQAQQYFDIKTKKKSFWGLSSSTSYNTQYQDVNEQLEYELGLVIANIGTSINTAVDILGINTQKSLNDYIINIGNMSFKDLSGDEIREQLESVISSESDLMATYLVPSLQEYQQVGEGLYETLIRLAQEQAVFNSVLELTGNAMAAVDANTTIAATQAIIDFAGGIENLQDAASTFFSEFLSEAEQFDYLQKNLTAQFEALGEPLPKTADDFKKLVQELNPLVEADQRLYAQLLLLSGQSAEYYDALEEQQQATADAIEAEQELALERAAAISSLKNDITDLVDDLVNPGVDYQSLIKAEETRWKNQQDAAEALYKTEMSRYESALSAEQTLDEYINGLAFSDKSTLAPWQQQELARTNFSSAIHRAENGDFSAVSDATSAASQYLDIGKERYGGDSDMYRRMFTDVNTTLSELSDFYATFEAPEQQIIEESPELISLREQLAASEAAAKQAENQALADLLASQLSELSELSGDSINSLIESLSIDLSQLGELLSVNLLELIDVTKQGLDSEISTVNTGNIAPSQESLANNIVAFPEIANPVVPGRVPEPTSTNNTNNNGNYAEVVTELKLLRAEVAAFREDANENADDAATQRTSQITAAEAQTEEIVRSNLRQVSVS